MPHDAPFYFTVGPSDLTAARLPAASQVMLVASSLWTGQRLGWRTPPACVTALVLDSGGFRAARKWGTYPWTVEAYAAWVRRYQDGPVPLQWAAVQDYACEQGVTRDVHATNLQRITATVANAVAASTVAPDLPWLPVVQGYTLDEYHACIAAYGEAGVALARCGLGTMCGRPVAEARHVLRALGQAYPHLRYHVFGMHLGVLDDHQAAAQVASWDSYAWNWPSDGALGRAAHRRRQRTLPAWTYSREVQSRAEEYRRRVQRALQQRPTLALL